MALRNYLSPEVLILGAVGAVQTGNAYSVADYKHCMLTLSSASNASFTVKFQWSFAETAPNFSAAQSNTNRWDFIQVRDYQDNASIAWDTWVAFAGADDVRMFEFNTNGLRWINATITAYSAWTISVRLMAFSNV